MDLLKYFNENIHMDKIKNFTGDLYDLALVRYVMREAAKIFYRDYTFFLNKENINDRDEIYNKAFDLKDIQEFSIVCKSYCNIIQEILKQNYDIESELISPYDDKFRHVDLLIKTKNGNRYIVDPLTDLIEMQVGMRTNNFASREHYDTLYAGVLDNIHFLQENELEEIDDKIGYKNNGVYLDDFLEQIKNKFDNYDIEKFSDDEKINMKLQFIARYLNNRQNIRGFVDFSMFAKIVIKKIFTESEQEKISVNMFWADEKDIKDEKLKNILKNQETRKRGVVISANGNNFIFSLSPDTLEYKDEEWEKTIAENHIFIRKKTPVKLLKYLKSNGADRNVLHNHEFLRLFNKFETYLLSQGYDLEEIKNRNVFIQGDLIITKFGDNYIGYKIEDGNLIIKDYKKNAKHIVFYNDEGRDISYKTERILEDKEKVYLYEFDSNGVIDIDDASGIENLVESLSNGKYLSRNASYYQAKTYSTIAQERKLLGEILTDDVSKKNFVILEYLSNASAKVYFEELKKMVENQDNHVLEAQKCFEEDCANIVRFFRNEPLLKPTYDLPSGDSKILERHIEMDNKQILYMFCSNLKFKKPKHILTPGLGSIFVGPMLKSMYGFEYTNILYSLYSKDEKLRNISIQKGFEEILSNSLWKTTEYDLVLIDDNVGSCNTMNSIRTQLEQRNKPCKFGAIKYNWKFYYEVKQGELQHPTFDVKDVDFLTIIDDPGYWIIRDSIEALKEEGGDAYVEQMRKEGLRKDNETDIEILLKLAEKYSQLAGVDLYNGDGKQVKKSSAFLCTNLREQIIELTRDIQSQDWSRDE